MGWWSAYVGAPWIVNSLSIVRLAVGAIVRSARIVSLGAGGIVSHPGSAAVRKDTVPAALSVTRVRQKLRRNSDRSGRWFRASLGSSWALKGAHP